MLELMNYNISSKIFKHGDILFDNSGNPGAVIIGSYSSNGKRPWNIRGRSVWLAVGLARIRGVDQSWNLNVNDSNFIDIPTIENPTVSWKLSNSITGSDGTGRFISSQSTEENMDATFNYTQPVKNSRELTNNILEFNPDYMAAKYCRSKVISEFGQMDLPSIDVLMRIFQSRNIIDNLDPTAITNSTKKLSNWGFGSYSGLDVWSSSEGGKSNSWYVYSSGYPHLDSSTKRAKFGVIPVLEIEI